MWTLYGIKNCDTMKKAFALFDELDVPYAFHDYKKYGIDEATLATFLDALGAARVVNRSGTTWRKLAPDQQASVETREGAIALCRANPSVIRRPIVKAPDGTLSAGFDEVGLRAWVGEARAT